MKALDWKIDTYEKAMLVINARDAGRSVQAKLSYFLEEYPEGRKLTHQTLAEILGLTREAVTRCLNSIQSYRKRKKCGS